MSGICDGLREDLSLYAEGELEGPRRTAIRLHLDVCPECRSWVEDYDAFTRAVLEEEPGPVPLQSPAFPPRSLRGDGGGPASGDEPLWISPSHGFRIIGGEERAFTDRVMAGVKRMEARRRLLRLGRLAAAVLLVGMAAGGGAWLVRSLPPAGVPEGEVASSAPRLEIKATGSASPVTVPAAASAAPASIPGSLASPWWVIDRGREDGTDEEGGVATNLYSRGTREDFLLLQALLGAVTRSRSEREPGLLMVPEEGAGEEAIPIRPVAFPRRVSEREIAAPTRSRLSSPGRRYKIIWLDAGGAPRGVPLLQPIDRGGPLPAFESERPQPGFGTRLERF